MNNGKGRIRWKGWQFHSLQSSNLFLSFFIFLDFCLSSHCFRTLGMLRRKVARKHTVLLDLATISGQNRKMLTCVRQCCSNVPMLVLFKTVVQCTSSHQHKQKTSEEPTTFNHLWTFNIRIILQTSLIRIYWMFIYHSNLTWGWPNDRSTVKMTRKKIASSKLLNLINTHCSILTRLVPVSYHSTIFLIPLHIAQLIWNVLICTSHRAKADLRICKSAALWIFCILSTTLQTQSTFLPVFFLSLLFP